MDAILYEYFHKKASAIYDKTPITFHKLKSPTPYVHSAIEEHMLTLHHNHDARVIVLNTKPISESFLKKLRKGTLLIRYGVGYDNIPLDLCQKLDILTAYTPDSVTQATTEFTIGLMLALTRKIHHHHANILAGKWELTKQPTAHSSKNPAEQTSASSSYASPPHDYRQTELRGKNLAILGYGRIGQRVAQICRDAFAMRVTILEKEASVKLLQSTQPQSVTSQSNHAQPHSSPTTTPDSTQATDENAQNSQSSYGGHREFTPFRYTSDLKTALCDADIVSVHTSFNPQTYHLLNETSLSYLKPTALIINTARGHIIDNDVLFRKLKEKSIGGAALDVFPQEPYPHYQDLQAIPNLLLTPHQGGNTLEANHRIATVIVNNILAYYQGNLDKITLIEPNITPSAKYKHLIKTSAPKL